MFCEQCEGTIFYGVQNNKYSKMFNRSLGGSITCRGRYLITLNGIVCEMFAGEYRFKNVGAIVHMISQVRKEVYSPLSMRVLTEADIGRPELVERLTGNTKNEKFKLIVTKIVNDLDDTMVKKVYFKNNMNAILESRFFNNFMKEFVQGANDNYLDMKDKIGDLDENNRVITLSQAIYSDAYHYPKTCKKIFTELETLIKELSFGFYWYDSDYVEEENTYTKSHLETFDTIDRYVISVVDTDSNMLLVDKPVERVYPYLKNTVIDEENKKHYNEIMSISIVTFILATYAAQCLNRYKWYTQMPEKNHYHVNMKNEFYFSDLFISSSRKNYIARITVKEGMVYDEPKFEVKGLAVKKAGNNENMRNVASDIIEMIFEQKDNKNLLLNMYEDMDAERKNIRESLNSDLGLDYFTSLKLADELDGVDETEHRAKAINMWNAIYPDNMIIPPANFYTIPLDVDSQKMKQMFPREYRILVTHMFRRTMYTNLAGQISRLTIELPAILERKGFHTKGVFTKWTQESLQLDARYNETITELFESDIDSEMLVLKYEELKKEAIAVRNRMDRELYDVYKTFRYPGTIYKMDRNEMKDNNYKLILKINNMKEYKKLFSNRNDTLEKFYTKIAMPIDSTEVPAFVRTFVSVDTFISLFDSLLAPILNETGMVFVRTGTDRRVGTNIKNYF